MAEESGNPQIPTPKILEQLEGGLTTERVVKESNTAVVAAVGLVSEDLAGVLETGFGNKDSKASICRKVKRSTITPRRTSQIPNILLIPDWTTLDEITPFYNPQTNKYNITIHTKYENTGGSLLPSRLEEAKILGITNLLKVYNKIFTKNILDKFLKIAEAKEYFIPVRPNPSCEPDTDDIPVFGMKVLVTIPAQFLDAIENKPIENTIEELPLAAKEIILNSSELRKTIKNISDIIRSYANEIENIKAKVSNINLNKEAQRVESVFSVLENLLISNGLLLREDQSDLIIIGTTEKFKPLYVVIDDGDSLIRLTTNFDIFIKTKPISNDRTLSLLVNKNNVVRQGAKSTGVALVDFLNDYIERPPDIKLSLSLDVNDPKNAAVGSPINNIKDLTKRLNDKSVKTEEEKEEEDELLSSISLKQAIFKSNENKKDFVGDVVLSVSNFKGLLDQVNSLEDVYQEVLNKVSLKSLIETALDCLPLPNLCDLAKSFLVNLACEPFLSVLSSEYGMSIFDTGTVVTNKLGINFIDIKEVQDAIRTNINKCYKNLPSSELSIILGRIGFTIGRKIHSINDLQKIPINTIIQALGKQGEKFLEDVCEDKKVRKALADLIPDELCELLNFELPDFNFKIPTIDLNDLLPTIDIMGEITIRIETAIIEILISILVDVVKQILIGILENCGDLSDINFGQINMNDLLKQGFNTNMDLDSYKDVLNSLKISAVGNETFADNLKNLIDNLSDLLSPSEISNLLNGEASDETIQLVNCLTSKKFFALKPVLDTPAKIDDLFESFGNLVNKDNLLDQISQQTQTFEEISKLCPDPEEGKRKILQNKGLSAEEIDQQIALANKRKRDRLKDLLDLLQKDKLDVLPPIFCNNTSKGLIERDHPSFKYMLDKTIDVVYDGVKMSFDQEISSFPTLLKETSTINVPKIVKREMIVTTPEGNEAKIINPEFKRLEAQGVPVLENIDDPESFVDEVQVFEDISFTTGYLANGLKQNLENIEFDRRLFSIQNNKLIFNIPNSINSSLISKLLSFTKKDGKVVNVDQSKILADIGKKINKEEIKSVEDQINELDSTDHFIEYILPSNQNENIDEYNISIFQKSSLQVEPRTLFNVSKVIPINQISLNFIQNKGLNKIDDTALPQSYFGSFVSKIWNNGATIYVNGSEADKPLYANGVGDARNAAYINGDFRKKFETDIYNNIFIDLLGSFSRRTSMSPLFSSKVLSLVDFTPDTKDCDPHLLDLASLKKKMKDDFDKCDENISPMTDGLTKRSLNSLEQSGVSGAVVTFIRLFVIELILKSIFVFSQFKISSLEEIDDVLISYFIDKIKENVINIGSITQDKNFSTQFNEQVIKTFNDLVDKGEAEGQKTTDDLNIALNYIIKTQILSIVKRITKLISSQGSVDMNKILLEEWIPLLDVANGKVRLANVDLKNISQTTNIIENNFLDKKLKFDLSNGSLILEKYIRLEDRDSNHSELQLKRKEKALFGVVNIDDFRDFIQITMRDIELRPNSPKFNFVDEFGSWSYGLRLSYVPPLDETFTTHTLSSGVALAGSGNSTHNIVSLESTSAFTNNSIFNSLKTKDATLKDKAFKTFEGKNTTVSGDYIKFSELVNGEVISEVTQRQINSFPLVCVEVPEENLQNFITDSNVSDIWNDKLDQLKNSLLDTPEYKFLFEFCFPLNRIVSLILLYNMVYLSNIKNLNNIFSGTKSSLKSVFQTLLNGGIYNHDDQSNKEKGGNAGILTTSIDNLNTEPDVPGFSLLAMAAKTPLLILKGLVELTDTNIGRARKIVDAAKLKDKDIKMIEASMGQLPMNVFPPYPLGPGICPPISTLGFLYLALDLDAVFESAKGKEVKRKTMSLESGLNLDLPCVDKEE